MIFATKIWRCTLLFLLLHIYPYASAQQGSALSFLSTTLDLGHIAEDGGSVLGCFEARNIGEQPMEVKSVVATCGCTSTSYERGVVGAGESFKLQVRFDPMNRPGRIDKHIFVEVSDADRPIELRLVGYVTPRERSVDEVYPFDMGAGLRFNSNFRAFGYVEHGKSVELRVGYINTSDRTVALAIRSVASSGALSIVAPRCIAAQEAGDIVLSYSLPINSDLYGSLDDRFEVLINDVKSSILLTTNAIAVDNFDAVDDISAPRVDISKNIIKFGEVNCANVVLKQTFELKNVGESPLVIRSVDSTYEAVTCSVKVGTVVPPGTTLSIDVELNPSYIEDRDNPFVARLRFVTNDPIKPLHTLRVSALPN